MDATLLRELRRAARNHQSMSLVLIDLDHFKQVNDSFGHDMGDALLREVGLLLLRSVRQSDAACRLGGEELLLLLPDCSAAQAYERADTIRGEISRLRITLSGKTLEHRTASFGISAFPESSDEPAGLIGAADSALYTAKQSGRDRVVVHDSVSVVLA